MHAGYSTGVAGVAELGGGRIRVGVERERRGSRMVTLRQDRVRRRRAAGEPGQRGLDVNRVSLLSTLLLLMVRATTCLGAVLVTGKISRIMRHCRPLQRGRSLQSRAPGIRVCLRTRTILITGLMLVIAPDIARLRCGRVRSKLQITRACRGCGEGFGRLRPRQLAPERRRKLPVALKVELPSWSAAPVEVEAAIISGRWIPLFVVARPCAARRARWHCAVAEIRLFAGRISWICVRVVVTIRPLSLYTPSVPPVLIV